MTVVTIRRGPFLPDEGRLEAVVVERGGEITVLGATPTAVELRDRAPAAMARGGLDDLLHGWNYHQLDWSAA